MPAVALITWWPLIAIEVAALTLVIALVVTLVIALIVASVAVIVLIEDDESCYHTRYPSTTCEDESDEKRPTPLVDHSKWWEDNCQ